jgi:L-threonylcarbamoyladenylate synthase
MPQVSPDALVAGALAGSLVSFPTDTVPALAAKPEQADLIFAAKQRGQDKPLILMGATAEALWPFVVGSPEEWEIWQKMAKLYWPGALTLILPASDRLPKTVNPLNPQTIGLRVPKSPIALSILAQTGTLATTSANRSGEPPLLTMTEIAAQFPEVLVLSADSLDAAISPAGIPSTVVKWQGNGWEVLRQGAVKLEVSCLSVI